jgi:hypothetical protein
MRIWSVTYLFVAALAFASAAGLRAEDTASDSHAWMGRILIAEDPGATLAFAPQPAAVRRMIEKGIASFTSKPNEKAGWLSLVATNDNVGIKVVSASGASGTRKVVVEAVVQGLLDAGLPSKQIIIWDRRLSDLRQAGFFDMAERFGVRVSGALEAGYDDKQFYETALLGRLVAGDRDFGKFGEGNGRKSYVSTLVTSNITKIINIVPHLNHNLAGVQGCLHSLAMGSVDNILRFEADPDRLGGAVPEIFALEPIADHVVLNIVDALISQYQGEERSLLHYSSALNELWFSKDPVALDVLSVTELVKQRAEAGAPKLRANLDILSNAAILDLGLADPARFRIERLATK